MIAGRKYITQQNSDLSCNIHLDQSANPVLSPVELQESQELGDQDTAYRKRFDAAIWEIHVDGQVDTDTHARGNKKHDRH